MVPAYRHALSSKSSVSSGHVPLRTYQETTNPTSADVMNLQEAIVSNFAGLLGSMSSGHSLPHDGNAAVSGAKKSATSQDFDDCISETVNDCDIVCSLPSLDLNTNKVNEDITMNVPLPKVGEHHNNRKVPEMVASVLDTAGSAVVANAEKPEKSAAQNLGSIASWTKSTLIYAPTALAKGVAKSFMSLVESRVKAWTLLLLRQSLTYGDVSSRNRLLSMLSSKIELQTSITSFKTLELPEHARQQPKEADVILPLIFEVLLQVRSQQRNEIISLRAPGTIVGHFAKSQICASPRLTKIEVNLDTGALLDSMVEQARLVVFKVVTRAIAVNVDKPLPPKQDLRPTPASLSGFSSALKLSPDVAAQSPKLQKALSSALRLNSILQGKGSGPSPVAQTPEGMAMTRKNRSVQWEHSVDPSKEDVGSFQAAKRKRLSQSQNRLRSTKSFGRPHAESGNREPKNATFGDFGRGAVAGGSIWGRDGKLLNHPVPQNGLTSSAMSSLNVTTTQNTNLNATFDFRSEGCFPRQVSASVASTLLPKSAPTSGGVGGKRALSGGFPSTLPRTATALESWLVMNTTKGNC